jgi:predicted TIM-barrel fold metal-dependent hydrolase
MPRIVSADDHVLEPRDLWTTRMPRRFLDAAPRVERLPSTGGKSLLDELGRQYDIPGTEGPRADYWRFEGSFWALTPQYAAAGLAKEAVTWTPITYDDIRPACFDPNARLVDMDINGVEGSLCFPNYSRFAGQRFSEAKDKDLGLACIRAYNDWMVDEWCAGSGGRLIPLCLVPLWDAQLAAGEVRRNAARGVNAVCFTEIPQYLGLPSLQSGWWDPFLDACNEVESTIAMHIGSGTRTFTTGPDMPSATGVTLMFVNSAASIAEVLATGILARFPRVKLLYAESQVGWIPYVLERIDDAWESTKFWHEDQRYADPPSTYYRGRIYSCMFKDHVGARLLDLLGEDQVLFETDYPHTDGTWPDSARRAEELLGALSVTTQTRILRENAIDLLHVEFSSPPTRTVEEIHLT